MADGADLHHDSKNSVSRYRVKLVGGKSDKIPQPQRHIGWRVFPTCRTPLHMSSFLSSSSDILVAGGCDSGTGL